MAWTSCIQPTTQCKVPYLGVVPNSDAEIDTEVKVLSAGNVSSNISKESLINFNTIGV